MEAKRNPIDPHITWAADYCKHCFTCINICPVKNLKFKGDEMASLGKCIQCQLCEKYCPDFALEVEPKKAVTRKPAAGAAAGKKPGSTRETSRTGTPKKGEIRKGERKTAGRKAGTKP